jgi:UDP-glucose 4-epimerase
VAGILVTGGAGFVGSAVVRALAARGTPVLVVDDLSAGAPVPAGVPFVRADVRDPAAMADAIGRARPDAVLHLAAIHHIPTCEADPRRATDVNVVGTQTVLDAAERAGVGRVVLASSGAVYAPADGPLAETAALAPVDVYATTKIANEHQLAVWTARTGGTGIAARLFNVIGPGDTNAHLVPDVVGRLTGARGPGAGPVPLALGNLASRRDYVHRDDAAEALVALLDGDVPPGFVAANVCTGRELSVAEVAGHVARLLGIAVAIGSRPDLRRRIDRASQRGDPTATRDRFGWTARRTAEDALAAVVDDLRAPPGTGG